MVIISRFLLLIIERGRERRKEGETERIGRVSLSLIELMKVCGGHIRHPLSCPTGVDNGNRIQLRTIMQRFNGSLFS